MEVSQEHSYRNLARARNQESEVNKLEKQTEKATPNGNSEQPKRLWCACGSELIKTCPECNGRFSREANYCGRCGAKLIDAIQRS